MNRIPIVIAVIVLLVVVFVGIKCTTGPRESPTNPDLGNKPPVVAATPTPPP